MTSVIKKTKEGNKTIYKDIRYKKLPVHSSGTSRKHAVKADKHTHVIGRLVTSPLIPPKKI